MLFYVCGWMGKGKLFLGFVLLRFGSWGLLV